MVGILSRQSADVDRPGAVPHKAQPELLSQLRVKIPYLGRRQVHRPAQIVPSREVRGAENQSFVHGQQELPVTDNAPFIPQGLLKRLAQADADVLHGVVVIHLDVPLADDGKVKIPVPGEELQHVVQKATAGSQLPPAGPIQIQSQADLRLPGVSFNRRGAHVPSLLCVKILPKKPERFRQRPRPTSPREAVCAVLSFGLAVVLQQPVQGLHQRRHLLPGADGNPYKVPDTVLAKPADQDAVLLPSPVQLLSGEAV